MKRLFRNQNGDTIVEVLLAITVLSVVLGISYSLATRAFRTLQTSRDQMQAVLILQEQAEGYRAVRDELSFSDFRATVEAPGAQTRIVTQSSGTDLLWHIEAASGQYPPYPLYRVSSEALFSDGDGDGADDTARITTTVDWDRLGGGADSQTLVTKLRDLKVAAIPPTPPPPPSEVYSVETTADNSLDGFFVNGQEVAFGGNRGDWTQIKRGFVTLTRPPDKIAIRATNYYPECGNWSCNPAMLIWSIRDSTDTVVARSGDIPFRVTSKNWGTDPSGWPEPDTSTWSSSVWSAPIDGQIWSWAMGGFTDRSARYIWPSSAVGNLALNRAFFYWANPFPSSSNVAVGKPVTNLGCAHGPPYTIGTPGRVTDGDHSNDTYNTAWYPGCYSISIQIDLGTIHNLSSLTAWWHVFGCGVGDACGNNNNYIDNWNIQVSPNGSSWSTAGSGGMPHAISSTVNGNFPNVRYIRVNASSSINWIGMYELEAFR